MDIELIDKLWNETKVDSGCWIWQGKRLLTRGERTYGYITVNRINRLVHRLSICIYLKLDYDDQSWESCHTCNNKTCWNPLHLYQGSRKTNAMDRYKEKTHCRQGHEWNKANVYIGPKGKYCRVCARKPTGLWRNRQPHKT